MGNPTGVPPVLERYGPMVDDTGGTLRGRRLRTVNLVQISYVLRLRHNGLRTGNFIGEIESVATGHSYPVRSLSHLVAYVLETADDDAATVGGHRQLALEP
jgi:hypothetical protein